MRRNLELKARCDDLDRARQSARRAGAKDAGVLLQTDTYFHVPTGRLKLREITGAPAELIWYARSDQTKLKLSRYIVSPVLDPQSLRDVLSMALGVRGIIRKRRELLLFENVRIHLDQVESLGRFIEFEAIISGPEDEPSSRQRLSHLSELMGISDQARVAVSYSDLAGI